MITLRYALLVVLVVVHDAVEARGGCPRSSQHDRQPIRREVGRADHMYQNKTATVGEISSSLPLTVASIQTPLPETDEDGYPEVPESDDPPYDDIPMNKGQAPEPVNVDDPGDGSQDRGHWTYDSAVYGDLPTSDWGDYGLTSAAMSSSLGLTSSEPFTTSGNVNTFIATTTLPSITAPASTITTFVTPAQTQLQDSSVGAKPFSYLETSSGFDPLPTGPVNLTSLWESQGPYQTGAWLNMVTINATWVLQPNTLLPSCATHSATIDHIIYVTTFTSTVTYRGPRAQYTPMPASLPPDSLITPPPALSTAATAHLSEVPLGTTMISGTYNLCLLPEKVYTAFILHCWGIGTRPAATTCYSQTYRDNVLKKPTPSSYSLVITTILVTAKGPTTVLPPQTTPDYGVPSGTDVPYVTHTPVGAPPTPISTPFYPVQTDTGSELDASNAGSGFGGQNAKSDSHGQPAQPTYLPAPVAIVFEPTAVVIAGHTFTDPVPSGAATFLAQTVTVGLSVFTILPDRVAGMGTTIDRPAFRQDTGGNGNGVFAESPTTGLLGSLYVSVSGFDVFVDGTRFALPAQPSTAVVHGGQTVYLGPDGISAQGQTLHISPVIATAGSEDQSGGLQHPLTEVVVAGGRLFAVDASRVVIGGSTIEYSNEQSTAVLAAGDTVTILPLVGIVYHGTTIKAPPSGATHYELVGGVTFSEVGSSIVVLDGHSYTLGSSGGGPTTITTVVDGETVVVGPSGVIVGSSLTFPYPFVPAVTITPQGATRSVSTTSSPTQSLRPSSNGGDVVASTPKSAASLQAIDMILVLAGTMVSLTFQ